MIHWAWLIAAFFGGTILAVVIVGLLHLSALRELEQEQQEHLQRLLDEYPLPNPTAKNQQPDADLASKV